MKNVRLGRRVGQEVMEVVKMIKYVTCIYNSAKMKPNNLYKQYVLIKNLNMKQSYHIVC